MGFFSSIGSAISGAFSSVCSGISSAVSSIGSALSSFATGAGSFIGGLVTALAPVAQALGRFANTFLQGLGILKPQEDIQDLGDRALQAANQGITLEKFADFDAYMEALREVKLDPEASAKRPQAEKLVAGLGLGTVGVEKKFGLEHGSMNNMWLLPITNPEYFTPERMQTMVATGRLGGDVMAYLENRLSGGDSMAFEKQLSVRQDGSPMGKDETSQLYNALDIAKDTMANFHKVMENYTPPAP